MSLSDIMGNLDLSVYPQVALVIFVAVFASVLRRTALGWSRESEACGLLPLEDGARGKAGPHRGDPTSSGRTGRGRA
ncbi:MAG: hypothetical protein KF787_11245 [Phycisphaeraceae bacterium]|nr:hypothetical protein [Phycisphaerae bacterium]MBX3393211.1 hypothetical protein [Phycisphaeraceae bacterium]